jgi:hypothetical protein
LDAANETEGKMDTLGLSEVSSMVDLNRRKNGILINPSLGVDGSVLAGLTVARYFFQEIGLSQSIAHIVPGELEPNGLFSPLDDVNLPNSYRVLAIDDSLIVPVDGQRGKWCLVRPNWLDIPISHEPPESLDLESFAKIPTRVMPMYEVDLYFDEHRLHYPLYDLILISIQDHLMDRLHHELQGLLSRYVSILASPEITDEGWAEELELAAPSLVAMNTVLPCLRRFTDDIRYEPFRTGESFMNDSLMFRRSSLTRTWSVYFRTNSGWEEIDPVLPNPPPFSQLLGRRDFISVLYHSAPMIFARVLKEIEKHIRWAKGMD